MATIFVNGKFLGMGLNGVHRTAAQFTSRLIDLAAEHRVEVQVLAPNPVDLGDEFAKIKPVYVPSMFGHRQGWEMIALPNAARNGPLVNFCNLAPISHENSVVMIHDAQTYLHPEDYSFRQSVAYRLLLPIIGARSRRILTVSEFSRQSLTAHGVGKLDKIDVVHNGTDHILDVAPDPAALERLGLRPQSYVMVLGSTKGYKNLNRVFEALAEPLPGGQRLLIAGGPGDRAAYEAKGMTPPGCAVFTGFVTDATLRALYEGAAIFAFPSRTEGFGLPPVEAMHCQTPVIAARAGAMPEVCGGAAMFVDPEDTTAWRTAIVDLISNQEQAEALRKAGDERRAEFSWEKAGQRLWDCLEPLI